jgi:hypothetical protein
VKKKSLDLSWVSYEIIKKFPNFKGTLLFHPSVTPINNELYIQSTDGETFFTMWYCNYLDIPIDMGLG